MLDALLPRTADNEYPGRRSALWLFGLLVLAKGGIALATIFNGYHAAAIADGIPLHAFGAAGAQTVVAMLGLWGVGHLALCALCIVVLMRYRALIPFMFTLLLLEHLGRKLVLVFVPIAAESAARGGMVNLVLLAITLVGLALSLRRRRSAAGAVPAP
jgi:hypothetical protein